MALDITQFTLLVILGTLAAIVYSLRILVMMERRVARMEKYIGRMVNKILAEEIKIERKLKRRR
ncbi:hypothetical protein DRJ19_03745 [Candidatus Woesearchaeota archaeon]|nr:MAG: hypothetical protein DRJ19_03745 [Candidatus Woesearchaeota archaeon]